MVTGTPGSGKSSLAYNFARELRLGRVLRWPVTGRSTLKSGLYEYDAIGRSQAAGLRHAVAASRRAEPESLVELDKRVCRSFPVVVITSNGEREFSAAFVRRCLRLESRIEAATAERPVERVTPTVPTTLRSNRRWHGADVFSGESQYSAGSAVSTSPERTASDRAPDSENASSKMSDTTFAPPVWGNIPPRNPNFTGRGELLDLLSKRLTDGSANAVLPQALHGMGGVGKTQMAVEYIYRHPIRIRRPRCPQGRRRAGWRPDGPGDAARRSHPPLRAELRSRTQVRLT